MKERPILFSGPMVRALLDGSKTQTRRSLRKQFPADAVMAEIPATDPIGGWVVSGHSGLWWDDAASCFDDAVRCPYGIPGDRIWVRESLGYDAEYGHYYAATKEPSLGNPQGRDWLHSYFEDGYDDFSLPKRSVPSIHMPRWASRITLEIIAVRVERLQDISEADAVAEGLTFSAAARRSPGCMGIYECWMPDGKTHFSDNACDLYRVLWEQINGPESWDANPWVWVISFRRINP